MVVHLVCRWVVVVRDVARLSLHVMIPPIVMWNVATSAACCRCLFGSSSRTDEKNTKGKKKSKKSIKWMNGRNCSSALLFLLPLEPISFLFAFSLVWICDVLLDWCGRGVDGAVGSQQLLWDKDEEKKRLIYTTTAGGTLGISVSHGNVCRERAIQRPSSPFLSMVSFGKENKSLPTCPWCSRKAVDLFMSASWWSLLLIGEVLVKCNAKFYE